MDTTKTITHVSLCAGYGGIDLGLSRAIPSLRTVAFSEIEAFACANLVAKMEAGLLDAAPIWTNLKTFPWSEFRDRVDILSGGYPCQPFSAAGKRLGRDDPRHLWPWIADGIRAMRPRVCFFENVEGHISLGLREVISELEGLGYKVAWGIFSAREVGAPHQRKRIFILAYREGERLPQFANIRAVWREVCTTSISGQLANGNEQRLERGIQQGVSPKEKQNEFIAGYGGALANSNGARGWEDRESSESWPTCTEQPSSDSRGSESRQIREGQAWPSRPGQPQHGWEPPRVVGNTSSQRCKQDTALRSEQQASGISEECGAGITEAMGNTSMLDGTGQAGGQWETQTGRTDTAQNDREAQPTLGGDSDGSAGGMDYAELCVTSDNRTDELRLLGNGVVPATAERAFRTLLTELQ